MAEQHQVTVEEHYVPRAYLKGFSSDTKSIYAYRIKDAFQPEGPVPIKSICRKDNLYELRNENDEIVGQNYLEKVLCGIEDLFGRHKTKLESKAFIESNYQSLYFLPKKEKDFWKSYIAIQIMRSPKILHLVQEQAEKEFQGTLKRNEARTIALNGCLPFFQRIEEGDRYFILDTLAVLNTMSIAVGVDETDSLFTSDFPVFCYAPEYRIADLEELRFPVTSRLMIFLFGGKRKKEYRKNSLFPLCDSELIFIKQSIAYAADEWIYSKKPLNDKEKKIIAAAYSEKMQDMSSKTSEE